MFLIENAEIKSNICNAKLMYKYVKPHDSKLTVNLHGIYTYKEKYLAE